MTTDVKLLSLPEELQGRGKSGAIKDYARACVEANTEALREEVERLTGCLATANANHEQFERQWYLAQTHAERLAEALRGLMLDSPGGHSCEEFHHYKSDRHMPGDDCPAQLRWNKAVTTAQAALRDHDREEGK